MRTCAVFSFYYKVLHIFFNHFRCSVSHFGIGIIINKFFKKGHIIITVTAYGAQVLFLKGKFVIFFQYET